MTNDRFGMGWGMAGGTTLASVEEAREAAILAEKAGFDSFGSMPPASIRPPPRQHWP